MANDISNLLKQELFGQTSNDPLLSLFELSHPSFDETIYLVNNAEDVVSNTITYTSFPLTLAMPSDDGESNRQVSISFDNVSLSLVEEFRKVTTPIDCIIRVVLASNPDNIQIEFLDLKLVSVSITSSIITARLIMDDFLHVELTSEKYTPQNFPGLF